MEEDDIDKDFRAHMDKLADSQSRSGKSVIMTPDKYDAIVQYLKNSDVAPDSSGFSRKNSWPVNSHVPYWIKFRGFRLQSFPEEGLVDVLVASAKVKDNSSDSSSPQVLRVLHSKDLYDIVKEVHGVKFQHGGYKRVLTYMQARYFGVTRGYVQEFCSQCPMCRPRKRRPANAMALDMVNQIIDQSSSHQSHVSHSQGSLHRPLHSAGMDSVEVIEVNESSGSEDDNSLPVFPSVSMSLTYARGVHAKTLCRRKGGARGLPYYGTRARTTAGGQEIGCLDASMRGNCEEQDFGFSEEKEKNLLGTPPTRVQNSRTRTVVQGDSVYIVTVNEDSEPEEETSCQKSHEKDGGSTHALRVSTSLKSVTEESDMPDFESSMDPHSSLYSPAPSLTENMDQEEVGCNDNQFPVGCNDNQLHVGCNDNQLHVGCNDNQLPVGCNDNQLPVGCNDNQFPVGCNDNQFPVGCNDNQLPVGCNDNQLPVGCNDNQFPVGCNDNQLPVGCNDNQLPVGCNDNQFPVGCNDNQLPVGCNDNQLPVGCNDNQLPVGCNDNQFPVGCNDNQLHVGCNDNQLHSQTVHNAHSFPAVQPPAASLDRKRKVLEPGWIHEKNDSSLKPVPKHVPVDPPHIKVKLERTDDCGQETFPQCANSKDMYSGCVDSNGTSGHNGFQHFQSTTDVRKRVVGFEDRNEGVRDHCHSAVELSPSGVVIKSEPDSSDEIEQNHNTINSTLKEDGSYESQTSCVSRAKMADGGLALQDVRARRKVKREEACNLQPCQAENSCQFFQHLHVDIIDMTHCPHDAFHYICHVTDHVSKLHVLFPLKQASAYDLAPMLDQRVLTYYGMPRFLHSNQGHQFVEELITALTQTVEGGVVCGNGEPQAGVGEGRGRGTNVVEELIAMLKMERCFNATDKEQVPWLSWLPRIMRSLNRDWYVSLRSSTIAASSRQPLV